ncbi:MAG TPA: class I SAM-dependent methyltransferase [Mycobacteriales bacterium]
MTLPPAYFDDLYAESEDPWGFTDRWYERRKRALTLALLPDEHYLSAYEPGCSIGVLTRELARRCDALLATDVATSAVRAARDRCADLPHVTVAQATLPADWPEQHFELVILSEIGYYFTPDDARELADRMFTSATTVVAVHWRHPVDDYPLGGDDVHAILDATAARHGFGRCARHVDDDIRGDVWSTDPRSVAAKAGLL